jgi:uncharacterized protein (TIGR03032 family)
MTESHQDQPNPAATSADPLAPGPLHIRIDDGFRALLRNRAISIAATVGPDGLILIGTKDDGMPHVEHKLISHAFAIAVDGPRLAVSDLRNITVYNRSTAMPRRHPDRPDLYDAFYTPLVSFHTGDCQVHDMAPSRRGLVVANTRFSTVCLIDGLANINPIWHPAFISAPMPEDRCHLNGLTVQDEQIRYVTAFGPYDTAGGWRNQSQFNGLLIDVAADRNLVEGLSMPHSPRLFGDRLYVCESGHGTVLEIDRQTGVRRTIATLPGLTRGLALHEGVFFVGLSAFRSSKNTWKLPIVSRHERLTAGIAAIDAQSGALLGMAIIENPAREVLDVKVLTGTRCPGIGDLHDPDEFHLIEGPSGSYWVKSSTGKPGA